MSAVAEAELVSKPEAAVLFVAMRSELRLTKKQRYPRRGPQGEVLGVTQGQYVGFRDCTFKCPAEGPFKLVDTLDGGEVEIEAAEVVRWLRAHRLYGDHSEGFWEVDAVAPPVSQDEMSNLLRAAWSEADLEALIAQETEGWGREAMLVPAREALDRLREAMAAAAEAQESAQEPQQAPSRATPRAKATGK